MCDVCRCSPCLTRCPNASDNPVLWCSVCGEGVNEGEEYWDLDNPVCTLCLHDMSVADIMDLLGYGLSVAEEDIMEEDIERRRGEEE